MKNAKVWPYWHTQHGSMMVGPQGPQGQQGVSHMSFHHEVLGAFRAGEVIRLLDGPFADAVILGFNDAGDMKVARPYAYVSSAGTTSPVPLTGVEFVIFPRSQLGHCKTITGGFLLHHSDYKE